MRTFGARQLALLWAWGSPLLTLYRLSQSGPQRRLRLRQHFLGGRTCRGLRLKFTGDGADSEGGSRPEKDCPYNFGLETIVSSGLWLSTSQPSAMHSRC